MTIKSSREIDEVFRSGTRYATQLIVMLVMNTPDRRGLQGRVAFVAGKRMGTAVTRNRAKRVMRAAVQRAGGPWPGRDVVLIAQAKTPGAAAQDLDRALATATTKAGLVR